MATASHFSVPVFQDSTWVAKWVQGRRGRPASSRSPSSASPTGSSKSPCRSTGKLESAPGARRTRKRANNCSPTNFCRTWIWQVQDHGSYLQLRHQGYFLVPTRSRTLPLPHPQCRTSSPQGTHLRYVHVECEPPSIHPPTGRPPAGPSALLAAPQIQLATSFSGLECVQLYWRRNTLPPYTQVH